MNYGVRVMKQIIEHQDEEFKVTVISPKGTATSTIFLNGAEQDSVDPMEGKAVKVVPLWKGKQLEVKTRWASTLKELPINRRFLRGAQMPAPQTRGAG
eukprot:g12643.t1